MDAADLDALEYDLNGPPEFLCQQPDGRKNWSEIARQAELFRLMHMLAPHVMGFAIPNAGKRNPRQAKREGLLAGLPDTQWLFRDLCAFVEIKGYDSRGRPGALKLAQIETCNRMHRLGWPVAMFFDPLVAVAWLRSIGFPVRPIS